MPKYRLTTHNHPPSEELHQETYPRGVIGGWQCLVAMLWVLLSSTLFNRFPPFQSPNSGQERKKRERGKGAMLLLDYLLLIRGVELLGVSPIFIVRISNF